MRSTAGRSGQRARHPQPDLRMTHNLAVVTTSWDDGATSDMRIAELLRARGLPGTFYVPIDGYKGKTTLGPPDLRSLWSEGFEIGAHTISHKMLPDLAPGELDHEVRGCKEILEQMLGRQVVTFCYPNGRYSNEVIRSVKSAGFQAARTTRMLCLSSHFAPFEMPTTLQAYPHRRAGYLRNLGRACTIPGVVKYATEFWNLPSWIDVGKKLFSQVLERGGVWHLYGHSWEIEELGMWDDLREMLDHVCRRDGVTYATNRSLLSL
jgi:peptidoglycan/xylan/chitin deacetylase (PgdA/CDA1 family)